jgi:hypothetical protein
MPQNILVRVFRLNQQKNPTHSPNQVKSWYNHRWSDRFYFKPQRLNLSQPKISGASSGWKRSDGIAQPKGIPRDFRVKSVENLSKNIRIKINLFKLHHQVNQRILGWVRRHIQEKFWKNQRTVRKRRKDQKYFQWLRCNHQRWRLIKLSSIIYRRSGKR